MDINNRKQKQIWGEKIRVFTGSKKYYDYLSDEYPEWFPTNTTVFEVSAALGLSHDKQIELKEKDPLANITNLDTAIFYPILFHKYPDKSPEEMLEELEKYAEYGVATIYKEIKQHGQVGYFQYLKQAFDELS